jgi:hypothetical protein
MSDLTEKLQALPDKCGVFYLEHYNDYQSLPISIGDLKALAESHEKLLAAVQHYADTKNWEASPISGNQVLYHPAFLHGSAVADDALIEYRKIWGIAEAEKI